MARDAGHECLDESEPEQRYVLKYRQGVGANPLGLVNKISDIVNSAAFPATELPTSEDEWQISSRIVVLDVQLPKAIRDTSAQNSRRVEARDRSTASDAKPQTWPVPSLRPVPLPDESIAALRHVLSELAQKGYHITAEVDKKVEEPLSSNELGTSGGE